jgi:2-polyprenyl-3-methyl-5-hydroxy-6-metoxy-1,4-benzoquinol methylase
VDKSVVNPDAHELQPADAADMTQTKNDRASSDNATIGDVLAERLFLAGIGAAELLTIHLGIELGLYEALAGGDGLTPAELAAVAGIDERYAREWLEQQAVASILDADDVSLPANQRRYKLPSDHYDVLLAPNSLRFSAPMSSFIVSFASVLDKLAEAFRTGGGIPYHDYGAAMREGQGAFNRPFFTNVLTQDWLPNALPELNRRLSTAPPARVADIGCGVGFSSICLARAYPLCVVDGFDSDVASIQEANAYARAAGVADRVQFQVHNAADPATKQYDAVFIFEALHDMSQPVAALTAARQVLKAGGVCVIMDEKVADEFTAPGDEVERFMFAASVLHCLPVGLASQPSAGTGTMLRRSILERYATEAGFTSVTTLAVEHDFFRLYRLEP